MKPGECVYLGDGVYLACGNHEFILTTGHHDSSQADNTIFLEPEVASDLAKRISETLAPAGDHSDQLPQAQEQEHMSREHLEALKRIAESLSFDQSTVAPVVHLNGTSKNALMDNLSDAHMAISDAMKTLNNAAPNGRDYYVVPGSMELAEQQHRWRQEQLQAVLDSIEREMDLIYEQEG